VGRGCIMTGETACSVIFNQSKREQFHPGSGFKKWNRKLRAQYKVQTNKDELTLGMLNDAGASVLIFGGPREMFTTPEFEVLKQYLADGGNVLLMLGEGGETNYETNINYLIEEYGISINSDSVVRTVYYKNPQSHNRYLHPKETFVSTGIVNREVSRIAAARSGEGSQVDKESLSFVYPYGATLNVQKPAVPILATGHIAFPLNRPVGAVFSHPKGRGRLVVLGSVHFFHDDYLEKEDNSKIMDFCMQWLTGAEGVTLNHIDAEDPDVSDYQQLPDTAALCRGVRSCLQESEELPRDFTSMFDEDLFKFDTALVPEAVNLYERLHVKKATLSLISPQFDVPQPPLNPAVFPPVLQEQPTPALDLFDLDEQFASDRVRLAHATNKCSDDDLEYFVCQAGEMLGVDKELPHHDKANPKAILYHMMERLANWKKLMD